MNKLNKIKNQVIRREQIPNSYPLRSNNCRLVLATKLEEEKKNLTRCPPLNKKRSFSYFEHKEAMGAVALGQKGKLSVNYKRNIGVTYIKQLFFEIGHIGAGSFGNVFSYCSIEEKKCYAIKIIKKYKKTDKYSEIRHLDEISGNPYCMQYINAWEELGVIYIQFELGIMSLADYAKKNHNITEEECWNILYDVLQALVPLHKEGYCHMDIKPDNIVITYDGKYKLCDFGLLANYENIDKTSVGSEGDAKYIAFEVLQGNINPAGDVFALGISIMELSMDLLLPVYGAPWHNIRKSSWRLLPDNTKGRISCELESTINWMMQSHPSNRPTAEQLLRIPKMVAKSRAKKERLNCFEHWYKNADVSIQIPHVFLPVPNEQNNFSIEDYLNHQNAGQPPITTEPVTPPRRVSAVIVRMSLDNVSLDRNESSKRNELMIE